MRIKRALPVFLLISSYCFAQSAAKGSSNSNADPGSQLANTGAAGAAASQMNLSPDAQQVVAAAIDHADAVEDTRSAATIKADDEYDLALAKYRQWTLSDLESTYRWQNISSIVIFVMVVLLVLAGVYFSWIQFRAAGFKSDATELDGSAQGIKITTSAIGLIILVLSMGFFIYI